MLHVISVLCAARYLHTIAPGPLECACWRQFVVQPRDCKKSRIAPLNAIILLLLRPPLPLLLLLLLLLLSLLLLSLLLLLLPDSGRVVLAEDCSNLPCGRIDTLAAIG